MMPFVRPESEEHDACQTATLDTIIEPEDDKEVSQACAGEDN
jgi:hypothetical protein